LGSLLIVLAIILEEEEKVLKDGEKRAWRLRILLCNRQTDYINVMNVCKKDIKISRRERLTYIRHAPGDGLGKQ